MGNQVSVQSNNNPLSLWKAILSYIIVALFLFFEMAVQVSPSVMTSSLMRDLNMGALGLGLMSGFYFYTYTGMQIPSGLLLDRFRPRYVIAVSIIVCSLGCLAFGLSTNIFWGSLARMLMGFGSAFAFIAVLVVTADLFKPKYFALITGITQMLAAFGAMSGQMPLSYLVGHIGWRQTMIVLAIIGFVLAIIVWLILNYKKDVLPKSERPCDECFSLSKILMNKQSWYIALYACLLWAPMSGFASLWGVPFIIHVYGLSKTSAALVCSMMWLGLATLSPLLGWFSTSIRSRVWPMAFSALAGAIAFGAILLFHIQSVFAAGVLVFIAGAACAGQALSFTVVKEINTAGRRATAISFNNMAVVISGAVFQPVLGRLLEFHCKGSQLFSTCESAHYRMSMLLIFGAYVVAFLLASFFIKESFSSSQ